MDKFSQEVLYNSIRRGEASLEYLQNVTTLENYHTNGISVNKVTNADNAGRRYLEKSWCPWRQHIFIKMLKRYYG